MFVELLLPAECFAVSGPKKVTLYFSIVLRVVSMGDKRKLSTKTKVKLYIVLFMIEHCEKKGCRFIRKSRKLIWIESVESSLGK